MLTRSASASGDGAGAHRIAGSEQTRKLIWAHFPFVLDHRFPSDGSFGGGGKSSAWRAELPTKLTNLSTWGVGFLLLFLFSRNPKIGSPVTVHTQRNRSG